MAPQTGTLHLGTQGFAFDDWVGPFYPPGTAKSAYLEAYARAFSTVEIDSTFYAAPRASVVEGWVRRTPDGFRFAAKFPKLITHDKKLDGARGDAEAAFAGYQICTISSRLSLGSAVNISGRSASTQW